MKQLVLAAMDQSLSLGVDWDLLLKALGFVVTTFVAYSQIRSLQSTSRTSLKTDLDILKLIEADDPNFAIVKQRIDERVRSLYGQTPRRNWFQFMWGLVCITGFTYWTFHLLRNGFTWWAVLTGYAGICCIGPAIMAFQGRFRSGLFGRGHLDSWRGHPAIKRK